MKQCPVCEKTFDDSLRFCQADGTPLVDKDEPVDPYKTMVARKEDIAAAIPKAPAEVKPAVPEPSIPAPLENEVLEIPPAADPNKTQVVSEEELRAEMAKRADDEKVIDVPPVASVASEPAESSQTPSTPPSPFGGSPSSTPPSPFAAKDNDLAESGPANFPTTPPIPSPFNAKPEGSTAEPSKPKTPSAPPLASAAEDEEPSLKPFEQPASSAPMAQAEFNPPAQSNMQNPQNFGQSAPPAAGGQSQTLAIISLIVGILSLCCGYTFIVPIIAIVLGFMARGKANNDPANYGGAGLALGGIITGAIALVLGVVVIILNLVMGFGGALLQGY
ncbi:MAG TPA: DUF4190 domain-containing protein [Pyrinomonadaceae bacterium]|nr:DUF4190 domain-containing protein [Pyrinomonadaceae bacterium]